MTKAEFITAIAEKADVTKKKAIDATDAFLETITELLQQGDEIIFPGFGKFSIKKRAARTGRNPQTGAELKIPARNAAHFSAGKQLKEAVNTKSKKKAAKKTAKKDDKKK